MTKNKKTFALMATVAAIGAIIGVYNLREKKTPLSGNFGAQKQEENKIILNSEQDETAIASFMGKENYPVTFIGSRPPANFTVGKSEPLPESGGSHISTPEEWQRTVKVYESKNYIADSCESYRFEIYPKTHEVVNVGLVYPKDKKQCDSSKNTLFAPSISDEEIKSIGEKYLERALGEKYSSIKNKFVMQPVSKEGDPDRWEWIYEDRNYNFPAGLEAEPKYPTVRLYISNSGNLLQYENSLPMFEK